MKRDKQPRKDRLSRRRFLGTALTGAAAAGLGATAPAAPAAPPAAEQWKPPPRYSDYLVQADKGNEVEPATEDNIEGPFYRPGAPFRTKLYDEGEKGDVLVISGTVVARNGRPLADALVEVWQASAAGRYDNDDPDNPPPKDFF